MHTGNVAFTAESLKHVYKFSYKPSIQVYQGTKREFSIVTKTPAFNQKPPFPWETGLPTGTAASWETCRSCVTQSTDAVENVCCYCSKGLVSPGPDGR